jgi:excisionase family DNA binding protein
MPQSTPTQRDLLAPFRHLIDAQHAAEGAEVQRQRRVEQAAERGASRPVKAASPLLTVEEVAGRLNVTERTVYNLIDRRKLPAVKLPGTRSRRIQEDDVVALIEAGRNS